MSTNIDIINLKKHIQILEEKLKHYTSREAVVLSNDFIILNAKNPADTDKKLFETLTKYADDTITKKQLQPKRTGAYNKPSGQLEDNWEKMLEIYNQNSELSLQKIADEMFKRHKIVISLYFVKRFRTIIQAQKQALAAETKLNVD